MTILVLVTAFVPVAANGAGVSPQVKHLSTARQWSGWLRTDQLHLLQDDRREIRDGYINDPRRFEALWRAFTPLSKDLKRITLEVPKVDFRKDVVLYSRNLDFKNLVRVDSAAVRRDGCAVLGVTETRTAQPIIDEVGIAFVVVPRTGLKKLESSTLKGSVEIPISHESSERP